MKSKLVRVASRAIAVTALLGTRLAAQPVTEPEPPASLSWQARIADANEPGERQEAEELRFEGDRYLTAQTIDGSRRQGRFGGVRPLTRGADGVWRCTFDIRLRRRQQ